VGVSLHDAVRPYDAQVFSNLRARLLVPVNHAREIFPRAANPLRNDGQRDYKKHRTTPKRTDPVDGIRFAMSFKPEVKRGLVTCCKWDVRLA